MGSFNTVKATTICPSCQQSVTVSVQFKYGDTWQHEYSMSQRLRWSGNDIGKPGRKLVVVDGVAETACPNCGHDNEWSFHIFVEYDHIVRVEPATGEYDFAKEGKTYIVLDEG